MEPPRWEKSSCLTIFENKIKCLKSVPSSHNRVSLILEIALRAFIFISRIRVDLETFEYLGMLGEKVQSLVQTVKKKEETLSLSEITLIKVEANLVKTNKALCSSCKTV